MRLNMGPVELNREVSRLGEDVRTAERSLLVQGTNARPYKPIFDSVRCYFISAAMRLGNGEMQGSAITFYSVTPVVSENRRFLRT